MQAAQKEMAFVIPRSLEIYLWLEEGEWGHPKCCLFRWKPKSKAKAVPYVHHWFCPRLPSKH